MINQNIEIGLIAVSMVNIVLISILTYKKKYGIAWALAFLEALIISGLITNP